MGESHVFTAMLLSQRDLLLVLFATTVRVYSVLIPLVTWPPCTLFSYYEYSCENFATILGTLCRVAFLDDVGAPCTLTMS